MKKLMFLMVFCALGISSALAQKTFSGTVIGPDGLGLPGVSVVEKANPTNGVYTDIDGKWTLTVPNGKTILEFSSIGMKTITIAAKDAAKLTMKSDAQLLDDVIVVGYGTSTKQSFTGTATKVSGEKLEMKNTSDISNALTGEAAGVTVINSSGQPGSNATIRIRGFGSVNGNRAPLYIVDGVPYSGDISAINPADIESSSILKDAAATAIYGARGANGVIVITTKKGKKGHSKIGVDVKYGVNMSLLPRYSTIKSPEEYIAMSWDALKYKKAAENELKVNNPEYPNYQYEDPTKWASDNLFSKVGIQDNYNMWDAAGNAVIDPTTGLVAAGVKRKYNPENWADEALQSSNRLEANVKLSGGAGKTSYYTSVGFLNDVGYSVNTDFKRISGRSSISHQVKEWLKGSVNMSYAHTTQNANGQSSDSGNAFWWLDNIPSIYPLYKRDANGDKIKDPYYGGWVYDYGDATEKGRGFGAFTNGIADANYNLSRTIGNMVSADSYLEASFLKNFKASSRFGLQYTDYNYTGRSNPFYGGSAKQNGSISKSRTTYLSYTWTKMLKYTNSWDVHNLDAFVAHENTDFERKRMSAYKTNIVNPFGEELNNAVVSNPASSYTEGFALESYFAQANYDYDKKYFLSLTLRRDGSSRFKKDKWGTFGAVGASWMVSKESFMESLDWVKEWKVKASYGIIGEQGGVGYYPGDDLYSIDNLDGGISLSFYTKGNPNLTWETSKMFQIGTEFNLWDRLDGVIDFYVKDTEDLIFDRRVGPSLGYAMIKVNDGSLRNSGLEFDFTGHIIKTNDLKLSLSVNGEMLHNEMLSTPIEPATGKQKVIDVAGVYGRSVGHSIYDFYLSEYAGVNPDTGKSMWNAYYDDKNDDGTAQDDEYISSLTAYMHDNENVNLKQTTTEEYAKATKKYVGKSIIPTLRGAFRLESSFKGFNLSAQFLYSFGGYAYDSAYAGLMRNGQIGGNNWHTDMRNRWKKPGDITDIPRLNSNFDATSASTSTRFLTKTDMLALNNVRLGYNFSEKLVKKVGLQKATVWISGDNLFSLTARDGFYPMTSETGASSSYRYMPLSTITAGVKVEF